MAALLVSHHRPGFYFRVLKEGEVGAGDEIIKVADGPERITVAGPRCAPLFAEPLARTACTLAANPRTQPRMENVFRGDCRREDFGWSGIPGSKLQAVRRRPGPVFGHCASPASIAKLPKWFRCP